jgi:hypothetical protein
MLGKVRIRFWIESALAAITAALFAVTLMSPEWIELLFGVDPDRGNGALEWGIVTILFIACLTFSAMARSDWTARDLDSASRP